MYIKIIIYFRPFFEIVKIATALNGLDALYVFLIFKLRGLLDI